MQLEDRTTKQAMKAARFLAAVVGFAHARQIETSTPCRVAGRAPVSSIQDLGCVIVAVVERRGAARQP